MVNNQEELITQEEIDFNMLYLPEYLTKLVLVDTLDKHGRCYQSDCEWFRANPDRKLLVRPEAKSEYHADFRLLREGLDENMEPWAHQDVVDDGVRYAPLTLVLIEQLKQGMLRRRPIWIGSSWSPEFPPNNYDSDAKIESMKIECARRNGGNDEPIRKFLVRLRRNVRKCPVFQERRRRRNAANSRVN